MSECTESMFEHLSELTTENATLTAKLAEAREQIERRRQQIKDEIARTQDVKDELAAMTKQRDSLRDECERLREALVRVCKIDTRVKRREFADKVLSASRRDADGDGRGK